MSSLIGIWEWPEPVEDGGLMAYGASLNGLIQREAAPVDRQGAGSDNPAILAVARRQGDRVKRTDMLQAHEVIQ